MSTYKKSKINQLLSTTPRGTVLLASELQKKGYSLELLRRYRDSGWLSSIGSGAMIRTGDPVDYLGALYALQQNTPIHVGGRTAIALQGRAHYLELAQKKVILFGSRRATLPLWFRQHDWKTEVELYTTTMLPADLDLIDIQVKEFTIKISGVPRAMMECLHLAQKNQTLSECYELMEGMNNVRPKVVQALLEQCHSVKVKRLFLFLAEHFQHEWFNYLDIDKIHLGQGKRSFVKDGKYNAKYKITLPPNWI